MTLYWNGSVATASDYTVFTSSLTGQQSNVPAAVTTLGQWTSAALASDTIFTVYVQTTDGSGVTPVSAALSVAVQVVQPDISVGAATINGNATVGGTLSAAGGAAIGNASTPSNLSVSGNAAIAGNAAVTGTLQSGAATVSSLTTSGAVNAGTLQIGSWTLSVDSDANFNISNGTVAFQLAPGGTCSYGGNQIIQNGTTCWIQNDQGCLNGTGKIGGGGARGWNATAYWMGNPPDGDSQLTITTSQPQ